MAVLRLPGPALRNEEEDALEAEGRCTGSAPISEYRMCGWGWRGRGPSLNWELEVLVLRCDE